MGENTAIEWAKHTFNPWWGCTKVAAGCTHCYAEAFAKRTGKAQWGDQGTRVKTSEANWKLPLKWNREAEAEGVRHRVFCASMADVFEDWQGPISTHRGTIAGCDRGDGVRRDLTMDDLRAELFKLIDATPHLDWLLLTKRPENIARMWPFEDGGLRAPFPGAPGGLGRPIPCVVQKRRENVWLLTSVAEQQDADRNIPELLRSRGLSPVLGLSCEPLVGPLTLQLAGIDWLILGGESGPKARPYDLVWDFGISRQCESYGVSLFRKQLGARPQINGEPMNIADPKGGDWNEWPEGLRVRDFPSVSI